MAEKWIEELTELLAKYLIDECGVPPTQVRARIREIVQAKYAAASRCPKCKGEGVAVPKPTKKNAGMLLDFMPCPKCHGKGRIVPNG